MKLSERPELRIDRTGWLDLGPGRLGLRLDRADLRHDWLYSGSYTNKRPVLLLDWLYLGSGKPDLRPEGLNFGPRIASGA